MRGVVGAPVCAAAREQKSKNCCTPSGTRLCLGFIGEHRCFLEHGSHFEALGDFGDRIANMRLQSS